MMQQEQDINDLVFEINTWRQHEFIQQAYVDLSTRMKELSQRQITRQRK